MKLKIEIEMDNAAFHDETGDGDTFEDSYATEEVKRILGEWLKGMHLSEDYEKKLFDLNGNHVGKVEVLDE